MTTITLSVSVEHWPIAGAFIISRGAKTEADVVVAELADGRHRGRGESAESETSRHADVARRSLCVDARPQPRRSFDLVSGAL